MKDLFVVTHTESIHHLKNKVGGWYDTGLTPRGKVDAMATADWLATMITDGDVDVFSSDLLRASQTAAIIAQRLQRPVIQTADLREISYGSAGGKPQDWLAERQVPAPDDNRMDHRGGVEDAETRREIATRVYRCVDSIVERACETQIIVTHGFALTFVIAAWIKMPIDTAGFVSFPARSGSITHLRRTISGGAVPLSDWLTLPIYRPRRRMAEIPIRCSAVSVVVLRLIEGQPEVLLLRRNHTLVGEWCQIAGAIEDGEKAWEAALREVKEETDLTCYRFYSADICEQFYEADRDSISLLPVFVGFVASSATVIINHEHSEFRWVSFDEALTMVPFAGQRHVLRHVKAEFVDREPVRHLLITEAP